MVSYLDIRTATASLERGNVSTILGMLQSINEQISGDVILGGVSVTIDRAMHQLRELQQLAYETMMEVEAERAARIRLRPNSQRKPN